MRKISVIIVALVAIVLVVFTFVVPNVTERNIKKPNVIESTGVTIGVIAPLTGNAAAAGEMIKRGVNIAVEKANSNGRIREYRIKVIYEDSMGSPKDGVAAMEKLLSNPNISAVVGGVFSSVTLAVAPIAERREIVLLSPASSNPQIRDAGDYIFRIWPSDTFEGQHMANFTIEELGLKRVAVLHSMDDYGVGIKNVFTDEFTAVGGNVIIMESYHKGDTDFRSQITKIKNTNPSAVYLIGHYQEMAQILKQSVELALDTKILSVSAFEVPELLDLADSAAEGVIYFTPTYDPNSQNKVVEEFVVDFENKYGKKPGIVEAHAYDAINVLIYAMNQNGTSATEIKNSLYQIKDFPGVTGKISFDSKGDVMKSLQPKIVKNREFVKYKQ